MKLASILFAFSRATFGPLICCHWYRSILPSLSLLSEPSRSTCELSTASRFFLTSASGRIFLIPVITSSSVVFGMMGFDSAFWFELSTVTLLLSSFGTFFSVVSYVNSRYALDRINCVKPAHSSWLIRIVT